MSHSETKLTTEQIAQAEKVLPMWRIVLSQFVEHRAAVLGLCVILFYLFIAIFAPVISKISGLDPEKQNPLQRYQKMGSYTQLNSEDRNDLLRKYLETNQDEAKAVLQDFNTKNLTTSPDLFEGLSSVIVKDFEELRSISNSIQQPNFKKLVSSFSTFHLFGTDELGRDVLIRMIYGTRVSLGVGLLVAIASALVGLLIGAFAGYHGGLLDTVLMRVTDSLLSLPTIPVLIVVAAIDLDKVPGARLIISQQNESILKLVTILILFSWMGVARLVRGSVLSLRERDFIMAAKTMGASDTTIIFRHLFPNVIAPLLVSVTLGVGGAILYEAALSFLGLGIQPPTPSWGNMLFNAQELITEAPFLAILPGLNILAVVMSFNYLGDGLQDAIDPKAIKR